MKSIVKTLLASGLLLGALAAHGQELKIGFVNLDRVLRDATPAKAAQTKLEAEFNKREKDLADADQRLKAASEGLRRLNEALLLIGEADAESPGPAAPALPSAAG